MFNKEDEWQDAPELATLYDIKPAPFQKLHNDCNYFASRLCQSLLDVHVSTLIL